MKLLRWWIKNQKNKITKSIQFSTCNRPPGYDWSWAVLDNGWSLFYGNIIFWITEGPAAGILIFSKDGKTYNEKNQGYHFIMRPPEVTFDSDTYAEWYKMQFQMKIDIARLTIQWIIITVIISGIIISLK